MKTDQETMRLVEAMRIRDAEREEEKRRFSPLRVIVGVFMVLAILAFAFRNL